MALGGTPKPLQKYYSCNFMSANWWKTHDVAWFTMGIRWAFSAKRHTNCFIDLCKNVRAVWVSLERQNENSDRGTASGSQWDRLMLLLLLHKKYSNSVAGGSICSNLFRFEFSVCCYCFPSVFFSGEFVCACVCVCVRVCVLGRCL